MLQQIASLWQERFKTEAPQLPKEIQHASSWRKVPYTIHSTAKLKSQALIPQRIYCLKMQDITFEGVDFHCSNILDQLGKDKQLVDLCHDLLVLSAVTPSDQEYGEEQIHAVWKSLIWKFSAGVNRRRSLIPGTKTKLTSSTSNLWTHLLS